MMYEEYRPNGTVSLRWNETNKRVETMAVDGVTVASFVPMTAEQSAAADAYIAKNVGMTNQRTVEQAIAQDLINLNVIIQNTSNATINASPASYIKDIARAVRRLDRKVLGDFTSAD